MRRGLVFVVSSIACASAASAACGSFDAVDATSSDAQAPEGGSANGDASPDGTVGIDAAGPDAAPADAFSEAAEAGMIPPLGKLVFVTKDTLVPGGTDFIALAKTLCSNESEAAGRAAQYVPWLSTTAQPAIGRLTPTSGAEWYLSDGTLMGDTSVFASGMLPHAIDRHADGSLASPAGKVWTGTASNGTVTSNCTDWTVSMPSTLGEYGLYLSVDSTWTNAQALECDMAARIYCFEE